MLIKRTKGSKVHFAAEIAKSGNVTKWVDNEHKLAAIEATDEQSAAVAKHYEGLSNGGTIEFIDAKGKQVRKVEGTVPPLPKSEPEPTPNDLKLAVAFQKERADTAEGVAKNWRQKFETSQKENADLKAGNKILLDDVKNLTAENEENEATKEKLEAELKTAKEAAELKPAAGECERALQAEIEKLRADLKAAEELNNEPSDWTTETPKPSEEEAAKMQQVLDTAKSGSFLTVPDGVKVELVDSRAKPDKSAAGPNAKKQP